MKMETHMRRGTHQRWARRIPPLILFGLLTTVTPTAHAECAWVLWGEVVIPGKLWGSTTEYVLIGAHATHAECLSAMRYDGKAGEVARARGGGVTTKDCLPDTVDPRGPKAAR
jgi:hypothetical protein